MAVPFSNTKLRVPRGFQNILEGLAREVLRNQPKDIYAFGAVYFEKLLKACQDGTVIDPAGHGAAMEDRFYNNKAFQKPDVDPSNPEQQDAALKIQTKYRQHHAKQVVQEKREDAAATKIQAGFRGMHDRQELHKQKEGGEEEKVGSAAPEEEEIDIDLNDPEVEAAATKIQAGFKGYKARKEGQETKSTEESEETPKAELEAAEEEVIDIDLDDPETEKAALKIQAGFKGYKTRKEKQQQQQPEQAEPAQEEAAPTEAPPTQPAEEEIDIDLEDPETEKAALKIQAGFKGMKARKEVKKRQEEGGDSTDATSAAAEETTAADAESASPPIETEKPQEEEEVDIDLNDPETEKAALKIQAGYKGFKTRKGMKEKQETTAEGEKPAEEGEKAETEAAPPTEESTDKKEEEEIDIDLNDPETEKAALKIQAGFKGMKTRRDMKTNKDATATESATDQVTEGEKTEGTNEQEAGEKEAAAETSEQAEPAPQEKAE